MISPEEEEHILTRAYVPEHIVGMMALISGGEPFLIDDHLGFAKDNWAILIGYPLTGKFAPTALERVIGRAREAFEAEGVQVLYGDPDSVFVQLHGGERAEAEWLRDRVQSCIAERIVSRSSLMCTISPTTPPAVTTSSPFLRALSSCSCFFACCRWGRMRRNQKIATNASSWRRKIAIPAPPLCPGAGVSIAKIGSPVTLAPCSYSGRATRGSTRRRCHR